MCSSGFRYRATADLHDLNDADAVPEVLSTADAAVIELAVYQAAGPLCRGQTGEEEEAGVAVRLLIDRVNTPIGEMLIVADGEGNLRAVDGARPPKTT